jgi:hypothetical protein
MNFQTPNTTEFIVLALAVWRLATLFANEDGPLDILLKFRARVGVIVDGPLQRHGENVVAKAIICVWCSSVWYGIFATILFLFVPDVTIFLSLPFALSGLTVVVEETTNRLAGF